jgi:hypothetical protein
VTGGWIGLHNKGLGDLYVSTSVIRRIKSRRLRRVGMWCEWVKIGMHIGYWWESQKEKDC